MAHPNYTATVNIEQLYRDHSGMVRARIRGFFPEQEVEDVLQEVFVRVMERAASFRGESSPSTWLYQITTHHCINRLRDTTRRRALLEEAHAPPWGAARVEADQPRKALLREILAACDEETRAIALYYYLDDYSRDDVAALVGLSSRTVGYRLEALRALVDSWAGA